MIEIFGQIGFAGAAVWFIWAVSSDVKRRRI